MSSNTMLAVPVKNAISSLDLKQAITSYLQSNFSRETAADAAPSLSEAQARPPFHQDTRASNAGFQRLVVPRVLLSSPPLCDTQALRNRTIDFSGSPDELRNNMTECAPRLTASDTRLLAIGVVLIDVAQCAHTMHHSRCIPPGPTGPDAMVPYQARCYITQAANLWM